MKRIIRVFPRRTKATPDDDMVRIAKPPSMFEEADEIHISVAFTWDMPLAERLDKLWRQVAPVQIGGPAMNEPGGNFQPGMYVKKGYVLTSRGCPNRCWFCQVWKREGEKIRELPITEGCNVLDDNLLACSDRHVMRVFAMLESQKANGHRIEFTGGLEAKKLKEWHVFSLRQLKPKQMFFAYDTPDDLKPLQIAGEMLLSAGFTTASHVLRAYVLCGYKKDTFAKAEIRMKETMDAGFIPMAMVFRDEKTPKDPEWTKWARPWIRPAIICSSVGASAARPLQVNGWGKPRS